MAEFYTKTKKTNTDYFDRYSKCEILKGKDGEILLETREIKDVGLTANDIYHTVQAHEERRLDIIAHTYYKNPMLWWVIAQANDIYDPLKSPKSGDILRIPSVNALYGENGVLM